MDLNLDNEHSALSVGFIAALAQSASTAQVLAITDVKDLGEGLPKAFPLLFDRRSQGGGLQSLKKFAEEWRLHPERRTGTANVGTLQAFIDLVNRHKTEHSAIFANTNWPNPSLTAVIDYHEKENGKPAFLGHRVHYAFPLTDEFKAWAGQDGKPMSQTEFAAWIEEHIAELSSPGDMERTEFEQLFRTTIATPADMVMLSRGLQVNVAAQVKNHVTLQSGEGEIVFVEEHKSASGEKIKVPGLFMVQLPAFVDGEPVRIPARLRYRVSSGSVTWFYQMFRWKVILRERVVADLNWANGETDLPTYEGTPEARG